MTRALRRGAVGIVAGTLVLVLAACASGAAPRQVDAEPVAERELDASVPSQPSGRIRLAEGVFRVHLSNIRCVRAPCPNGYLVSNVDGHPPAVRPEAVQPVSRIPQDVRFDAASGGAVPERLVEQAHVGDGIVVEGRAWLIEGGRVLRVEVARLLEAG
ncbi:hypothetical protein [Luteimonas deserti]|uniref:Lipoprotein n=1 Tax=Luteimonas deserti TaxID=2752306 RepID=A0A7Z0QPK6_9GAMM|nr:hypothetical protein [Luteimonas deserti]NYZ61263.1 hypothetical protein [Luteimonas deserti]